MKMEIFKKVHLSEKKRILKLIAEESGLVLLKFEKIDVKKLRARELIDEKYLECEVNEEERFILPQAESVVVNLSYEEDRFFMSGMATSDGHRVVLDIQSELYYLQRRKSMRMEIPGKYKAKANIVQSNGKIIPVDFKILDISSGGCKMSFPALEPSLKVNTKFKIILYLGNRTSIDVDVQVRHSREIKPEEMSENYIASYTPSQVMGVQFLVKDSVFEAKMLNLFMDVQREIFLKFKK